MANQETAYGLRPIGLVGASANSTGITQYEIASNNTNAIFQFSIVVCLHAILLNIWANHTVSFASCLTTLGYNLQHFDTFAP